MEVVPDDIVAFGTDGKVEPWQRDPTLLPNGARLALVIIADEQ